MTLTSLFVSNIIVTLRVFDYTVTYSFLSTDERKIFLSYEKADYLLIFHYNIFFPVTYANSICYTVTFMLLYISETNLLLSNNAWSRYYKTKLYLVIRSFTNDCSTMN